MSDPLILRSYPQDSMPIAEALEWLETLSPLPEIFLGERLYRLGLDRLMKTVMLTEEDVASIEFNKVAMLFQSPNALSRIDSIRNSPDGKGVVILRGIASFVVTEAGFNARLEETGVRDALSYPVTYKLVADAHYLEMLEGETQRYDRREEDGDISRTVYMGRTTYRLNRDAPKVFNTIKKSHVQRSASGNRQTQAQVREEHLIALTHKSRRANAVGGTYEATALQGMQGKTDILYTVSDVEDVLDKQMNALDEVERTRSLVHTEIDHLEKVAKQEAPDNSIGQAGDVFIGTDRSWWTKSTHGWALEDYLPVPASDIESIVLSEWERGQKYDELKTLFGVNGFVDADRQKESSITALVNSVPVADIQLKTVRAGRLHNWSSWWYVERTGERDLVIIPSGQVYMRVGGVWENQHINVYRGRAYTRPIGSDWSSWDIHMGAIVDSQAPWDSYRLIESRLDEYEGRLKETFGLAKHLTPESPDELRAVHKARLESVAAARLAEIVGVVSNQGALLPPGCAEQQEALTEVSAIKQRGFIALNQESSPTEFPALTANYIKQIEDVKVLNSPEWVFGGNQTRRITWRWQDFTGAGDSELVEKELPLVISVRNPTPSASDLILGPIALDVVGRSNHFSVSPTPGANGEVAIKYVNSAGVSNALPYGLHQIKVDARNVCGNTRLTIDIEQPQDIINDVNFNTVLTPDDVDDRWSISRAKEAVVEDVMGDDGSTTKALKITDSDPSPEVVISSEYFTVRQDARYEVSVDAWQTRGSAVNYLFVAFYDADKVSLNRELYDEGTPGSGASKYPKGWASFSTYAYWGVVNAPLPSTRTTHTFTFGAGGVGSIPQEAAFMKVGALLGYRHSGEFEAWMTQYRLKELLPVAPSGAE